MKTLQTQFKKNADKSGTMTFTQLKRDGDVALYQRTRKDGTHFNYEVFLVKEAKAGAKLPGGAVEKEDRERYPGAEAFGRTAYDCSTMDQAETRFEELVKRSKALSEARIETAKTGKRVRPTKVAKGVTVPIATVTATTVEVVDAVDTVRVKGRKAVDRSQLKFPDGEWTMKQAHALNPTVCHATVWTYCKQLVKSGDLLVCGAKSGGRGKATLLYRFPTESEKAAAVAIEQPTVQGDEPF